MANKIQLYSKVTNNHLDSNCRESIIRYLRMLDGKPIKVTIEEVKRKRSTNQNAFYWAVFIPLIVNKFNEYGNNVDSEQVHEFLKDEVGKLSGNIFLPNGEMKRISGSSAELQTGKFEDYLEKIRVWALDILEISLPMPNEF